ncbi:Ser/Thr protein kinase RdoA involved in Cpx stress response, MazF antagonist [Rhodospirillales bacterium URHD0017]|nr:Ser/Thr protein kinase RdoA involved in Cpx stress response, MazF antagonist [Rhodospirillales bacterium URHD0017]
MDLTPNDSAVASEIAEAFLRERVRSVRPIGQGSNNKNLLVETANGRAVVKLSHEHRRHRALQDYQKENWCIEQSSALGVPGPSVLAVGQVDGNAFMIETFVEGINGKQVKGDRSAIWRKLGEYARLTHSIKVTGWGEDFFDDRPGGQQASWLRYLTYNIESLTAGDPLIDLGVLDREQLPAARRLLEELRDKAFQFGVNHGDLALWNTLVESSGKINLLDWGSAEAHIVPHFDLLYVFRQHLRDGTPTVEEMAAFRQGYGLSDEEHERLKLELDRLFLLIRFDKLRWAIERKPSRMEEYVERAKTALRFNLGDK